MSCAATCRYLDFFVRKSISHFIFQPLSGWYVFRGRVDLYVCVKSMTRTIWSGFCSMSSNERTAAQAAVSSSQERAAKVWKIAWAGHRRRRKSFKRRFAEDYTITEKDPNRAFSWLKASTSAFTFKTLYYKDTMLNRRLNLVCRPETGTLAQKIITDRRL